MFRKWVEWIESEVKKGGIYLLFIGVTGWGDHDSLYIAPMKIEINYEHIVSIFL